MAPCAQTGSGRLSRGLLLLWGKCAGGGPGATGGGRLRASHHPARGRPPACGARGRGLGSAQPTAHPGTGPAGQSRGRPWRPSSAWPGASGRRATGAVGCPPPRSSPVFWRMTHKRVAGEPCEAPGWEPWHHTCLCGEGLDGAVRDRDRDRVGCPHLQPPCQPGSTPQPVPGRVGAPHERPRQSPLVRFST